MSSSRSLPRLCLVALFVVLLLPLPAAAAPLDIGAELTVVKEAYDALNKNLYIEPDNTLMLTNAYTAAQKTLDAAIPAKGVFTGKKDAAWATFEESVRVLADRSATDLAQGTVSQKLIESFADTVNDAHTAFLSKRIADQQRKEDKGDTSITLYGLRAVFSYGSVYVAQVIPGGNMEAAGVQQGDQILALDGTEVTEKNYRMLFAPPKAGDVHEVKLQRASQLLPFTLTVTTQTFRQVPLTYMVLEGHIGYIRTFQFYKDFPEKLDEALDALHAANVDVLILDLRGNPGGYATAEEKATGRWLADKTEYGCNVGRAIGKNCSTAVSSGRKLETLPTVVMLDKGSASASEYLALALRDFKQSPIIGSKTTGVLGTAYTKYLSDGTGIEITIGVYTTAKGEALNGIGITPDVEVADPTTQETISNIDKQLYAAISVANGKVGRAAADMLPLAA